MLDLRIRRKELKIRSYLCRLPSVVNAMPNLSIVPSSSADITRALRECFPVEFISFCFVSKQRKISNVVGMSSLIYDYKQGNFGYRYVLIHSETLIGV